MYRHLLIILLFAPVFQACSQKLMKASPERLEARINALSRFGANPEGGVSRVAYSQADIDGRKYIMDLMKNAGLEVSIDPGGNIIGRRAGANNQLPVIAFGSHIDSVPGGGNYDGDVGVVGAIECIELLNEHQLRTTHPLEVIVFQNEEGGVTGSEIMCGKFKEEKLSYVTASGKTIRQGISDIGGDPSRLQQATRRREDFKAFLELHIEQGGTLEKEKYNIGVVEGIVGIKHWRVTVTGKANHAGTTPMNDRQDALLAAAMFVTEVNRTVRSTPGRQVATVGVIRAEPGAPNVIPGKTELMLEIRDLSFAKLESVFEMIRSAGEKIEKETKTTIEYQTTNENLPAMTDRRIQELIAVSAKELGLTTLQLPSGAGHDTQEMATITPSGMIFVPSKEGISHSPKEYTSPGDMANGVNVLLRTLLKIDGGKL